MVHATAGVTAPATGISQSVADQNQDRFGLNGGRSTTTGVIIDGVNASAGNSWNGLLVSPAIDSVAEVQVIRNAYDAQYGRSGGGMISIVTKGGGSDFHGTVFDFLRNSQLDANSWTNNRSACRSRSSSAISMAANFAGPVWRSKKLFFFGGYEALRQGSPSTSVVHSADGLAARRRFLEDVQSEWISFRYLQSIHQRLNPAGSGYIRDPFPNNRIPVGQHGSGGRENGGSLSRSDRPGRPDHRRS
jgi:hypothetical protein